jgi:hypothetical protein|tara:strand:- start:276 stop:1178 length:903 start_codon:yes stop_codon:yes gene_type:complete
MARRVSRKKKSVKAAVPNYREDSKTTSGPDPKLAIIALLLVVLLIGSGLYLTSMVDEAPEVSYGVEADLLTDNHKTEAGYDTDFVMIIKNTGSITDTFDISVKSNDGGFTITVEDNYESVVIESGKRKPVIINVKTSESSQGVLYAFMEISSRGDRGQTADVKLTVDTDHEFGNKTSFGNSVDVHYAGILASNSKLFDSSMEYIWDNYMHRKEGVTEQNRHTATLNANNIGCDGEGYPTTDCEGGRGMIKGFDTKMVGMYEGQTLSVRIPAKDAYGEAGASSSDLAGEDLIFTIEMVKIN